MLPRNVDMKSWLSDRAEEIAQDKYQCSYYDLPQPLQPLVWIVAEQDWVDIQATRIDAARDAIKYKGV